MLFLKLFEMFAKQSLFAFGGGYVVISMMMKDLESNKLLPVSAFTDAMAIAGMSPGPVAVNAAVGVGYRISGLPGVIAASLGMALPCVLLVILVARYFFKVYDSPLLKAVLYGLGPVTAGIILFSAVNLARKNGIFIAEPESLLKKGYNVIVYGIQLFEIKSVLIGAAAFIILAKTKIHPVLILIGSGILGILIF